MAQPNFETVAANLQSIHHEVSLVGNVPAMGGLADLRQQLNTNHTQIVDLIRQLRGQFTEMQDLVGDIQEQVGNLQERVGELQGQVGEVQEKIQQLQDEYLCLPLPNLLV